jgi:hypothetical protein
MIDTRASAPPGRVRSGRNSAGWLIFLLSFCDWRCAPGHVLVDVWVTRLTSRRKRGDCAMCTMYRARPSGRADTPRGC